MKFNFVFAKTLCHPRELVGKIKVNYNFKNNNYENIFSEDFGKDILLRISLVSIQASTILTFHVRRF